MCGNDDSGNSMPETGKIGQAIERLADIRRFGGASSEIMVFESEQRSTTTAHAERRILSFVDSGAKQIARHFTVARYLLPNYS